MADTIEGLKKLVMSMQTEIIMLELDIEELRETLPRNTNNPNQEMRLKRANRFLDKVWKRIHDKENKNG